MSRDIIKNETGTRGSNKKSIGKQRWSDQMNRDLERNSSSESEDTQSRSKQKKERQGIPSHQTTRLLLTFDLYMNQRAKLIQVKEMVEANDYGRHRQQRGWIQSVGLNGRICRFGSGGGGNSSTSTHPERLVLLILDSCQLKCPYMNKMIFHPYVKCIECFFISNLSLSLAPIFISLESLHSHIDDDK
ncbi:hypothetical protein BLOT_000231 [Blomia tropicalis]|nr:hypothetical protein BLOT_000231 [Blomia tropicalis]